MPKSLADGRPKLTILATKPADPAAPTITELTAGIEASCRILSSDYALGPADSDKVPEKELCKEGNANAIGASNYEGSLTPFRYFTEDGASDAEGDEVFQALKTKGTLIWLVERETSKKSTEDWMAADEISVYEAITDNPQKPSDQAGYIKRVVKLEIQAAWLNGAVAAGV